MTSTPNLPGSAVSDFCVWVLWARARPAGGSRCSSGPWDQQEGGPRPQGRWHLCGSGRDVWESHLLLKVCNSGRGHLLRQESGDTPDLAQLIIFRTVISPPSSGEVPVQAWGAGIFQELATHCWGFARKGDLKLRYQLFRTRGRSVRGRVFVS